MEEWIEFSKQKPPHEGVLAACDTYDCGWVIDSVWWYEDEQCWMTTGTVESLPAHLNYSHWRKMPEPPKETSESKESNSPIIEQEIKKTNFLSRIKNLFI